MSVNTFCISNLFNYCKFFFYVPFSSSNIICHDPPRLLLLNFIVPEFMAKEYFRLIVDTEIDLKNFEWVTLESYGDLDNFERLFNQ